MTSKKFSELTIEEAEQFLVKNNGIDKADIEKVVKECNKEFFKLIGIDADEDYKETQKDFVFLRDQRKGAEQTMLFIKRGSITIIVTGLFWAVYQGIKHYFTK